MIHDVYDLLCKQPGIDRMTDESGTRNTVIQFEVPKIVPGQCGDRLKRFQTQVLQSVGEFSHSFECVPIAVSMPLMIMRNRYDLAFAVLPLRMTHDRGDRQRLAHHQSVHLVALLSQ